MHIDVHGKGNDHSIVLIHGWAMHGGIFRPLVERLARHAQVHVVDLPGHGLSREDARGFDLAESVDRIVHRVPPSIWVGWSLGGLVAMRAAMVASASVRALALVCASPCFANNEGWTHGVPVELLRQLGQDLATDYRGTIARFLALEAQDDEHAIQCLRELRAQVFERGEPDPGALETALYTLEHTDYSGAMAHIQCPSVWIAGGRDRLVPWQAMMVGAEQAGGRFHRIDGAAHAPFLTHLAEVWGQIDQLQREVDPA